jgi:uncharacterized membrane protein
MSLAVALHLTFAALGLVLGVWILSRPKGTSAHRALGRIWVASMAVVGVTSLWIPAFLTFSWIHLFTLVIAVSVPSALRAIRHGRVRAHRFGMIATFCGLCGAGLGALAPGRIVGGALWGTLGLR